VASGERDALDVRRERDAEAAQTQFFRRNHHSCNAVVTTINPHT
jgi:hypothetical protein